MPRSIRAHGAEPFGFKENREGRAWMRWERWPPTHQEALCRRSPRSIASSECFGRIVQGRCPIGQLTPFWDPGKRETAARPPIPEECCVDDHVLHIVGTLHMQGAQSSTQTISTRVLAGRRGRFAFGQLQAVWRPHCSHENRSGCPLCAGAEIPSRLYQLDIERLERKKSVQLTTIRCVHLLGACQPALRPVRHGPPFRPRAAPGGCTGTVALRKRLLGRARELPVVWKKV